MNIQFKKGVLELCVLSLLNRKDFYGYELVDRISKYINISKGQYITEDLGWRPCLPT